MVQFSEKDPLLAKETPESVPDPEPTTIRCPSFSSILANPFSCLPQLGKKLVKEDDQLQEYDEDEDDDAPLPDLPYTVNPVILGKSALSQGDKLYQLRKVMKEHNIGVYIIPTADEHQSEWIALSDRRREYISGFTGSAGTVVVTLDDSESLSGEAALSTDGRYFVQAEKELESRYWRLLKEGIPGNPSWKNYAIDKALANKFSRVISVDPRLITLSVAEFFQSSQLRYQNKYSFEPLLDVNLVDVVWGSEKPSRSLEPVYHLPLKFSGRHTNEKVKEIRAVLNSDEFKSSHLVISSLDEIAWLFNLRSDTDVPFTPVFFAYAIVTLNSVILYTYKEKLEKGDKALQRYLKSIRGLVVKDYNELYSDLSELKVTVQNTNTAIVLPDRGSTPFALYNQIPTSEAKHSIKFESIISYLKIVKNPTELLNAKVAQYKDSLAFILFASWLEHTLLVKKKTINEYEAACKIFSIREKFPYFKGLSYESISSTGANAAIIHYAPTKESNSVIDPDKVYLLDSGSQYLDGTTDITRTYKFGTKGLTPRLQKLYTLVLKGHLAVAVAKFPPNSSTTGTILDAYARQPLWNEGLDFNHGTGHGVGSFGTVHESPLYIPSPGGPHDYFKKGAILTDEPGYYVNGELGIRIESELEIIETSDRFGKTRHGENFLGFAYLTKVPFCRLLIDTKYLSPQEVNWINEYHKSIRDEYSDTLLKLGNKRAHKWLLRETAPL